MHAHNDFAKITVSLSQPCFKLTSQVKAEDRVKHLNIYYIDESPFVSHNYTDTYITYAHIRRFPPRKIDHNSTNASF